MEPSAQDTPTNWLGRRPLRAILRILVTLAGVGATGWALSTVWPEQDRVARGAPPSVDNPASLAPYPLEPVTVLLVGVDSDTLSAASNQAAPQGPANADALLLLRISSAEPLQLLQVPVELAVQLPGSQQPMALGGVWQQGGVALTVDALQEIIGLPVGVPQRYVVMPRNGLRTVVEALGEVEVTLNQTYQRTDKAQGYTVNLQAGRQSLNGAQAEQLVRYRKDSQDHPNRRIRQQILLRAMISQVQSASGIGIIRGLLEDIAGQMDTNLSEAEMLGLAAALIASPSPATITQLPLATRAGKQTLRQLKPGLSQPLWPSS
ncbi:MAG: LCP family protein [Parasynechococcus sp.]|uniref:LCP family protein n=1 Tax=Parasynechococcus sp. TaxID=3101203 RepID=UPI000DFC2FBF|nr:MAG: LytR family transcriptional regulator [Synechococcus sp. MED-G70]HCX53711.1 LytR family transcriptional regulator [Synechococcus sp. UBA9887]|tara:strand:+ start:3006 stop:3965 length:960 start_codon:yes stop_codon:yes gene_type:complete